jgi:hypothetical protein
VGTHIYVFASWSDGGAAEHTISTPAADTTYTARFIEVPPALPLGTASAVQPLQVALTAPKRTHWRHAKRQGIPVRVTAPSGTRIVVALRRGQRRLAARTATVGTTGARLVRLHVKRRVAPGALRIHVSAAGADGQRIQASRKIVLKR